uniref:Protein O-mannosyltransferase 1 n=1 Tax=Evadne anonyx TaxID=141404 RepID=A0A9N6WX96_9CRUS|nr:EOG090X015P [Evadne anonyx]
MADAEVRNRSIARSSKSKKKAQNAPAQPEEKEVVAEPNEKCASSEEAVSKTVPKSKSKTKSKSNSKTSVDDLILPSLEVNCHLHLLPLLLFSVAVATRFYALDEPNHIVFDELHYGRYASLYLKGTFFYDSHPPLGKQLLALAAYTAGFDGDFKFDKIGAPYNSSVPVYALRAVPATFGSLLIPVAYMIMAQLGFSQWTSALAGFLFIFDNALLTQSHYMLMEPIVLFFALSGLLCVLKFRALDPVADAFSLRWWGYLTSGMVLLTCSFCVKYVAVYSYMLGLAIIGYDYWENILGDLSLSKMWVMVHAAARATVATLVPIAVYLGVFYIHLTILVNAGPHDNAMSSTFQASLEGGLSSILRGQPLEVVHGSQITMRHTYGTPCWLHSHADNYPVKYADKRGSSHQQQVTCYPVKDANNWWLVKRPERDDLLVTPPLDKIKHGDIVQLVHGITMNNLNTHNVAAPMSATKQEVSCYVDHNVSMPAQDLWRLVIVNRQEVGDVWHALSSLVRFVHVNTSAALAVSGRSLPDWGNHQLEVVADVMTEQEYTIFNVEEHRYTKNSEKTTREYELLNSDFVPLEPVKMTFMEKFIELQIRMIFISNENVQNHIYTSSPWEWLTLTRGIAYWVDSKSNAQVHLLGNVFIWYSATIALMAYFALLIFYMLRQRRQCYDIHSDEWTQFRTTGEIILLGYVFHFVPYFFVDHTLFLHHYLPALVFQLMLTASLVEHLFYLTRLVFARQIINWVFVFAVLAWMCGILFMFKKFLPLSYGLGPMNATQIQELKFKESWDFIIHKP